MASTRTLTSALLPASQDLPFTTFQYGYPDNYYQQTTPGTALDYSFDTGFALLNPWPPLVGTNTPVNEERLSAMFPSTASGSVYQLTGWLCGAPQLPYPIPDPPPYIPNDTLLQDITSSQQLLSNAENGPLVVTKEKGGYTVSNTVYQSTIQNPSKCQTLSTLPTDFASAQAGVADRYLPSSSPVTAAHVVDGALPNFAGTGGFAFTGMDSSEADFYGLLPAALQNAAGSFELPTPSSVLAALNDETTNADGTLSPNFDDTGDTGAYPMPMVTYALVSTAPQPSLTEAAELKDMLTNLVGYSHSAGAGTTDPLPSGYVPLPDNLYQDALADIAKDVVGPGGVAPPSPGTPGTPGNTGSPGAPGQQGVATGRGTAFHFNTGGAASRSGASAASGSSGAVSSGGTGDYFGHLITVTLGDSRFFIPGLLLLALVCLIGGPLLYLYPSLRKAHAGADGDVESEGSEPPARSGARRLMDSLAYLDPATENPTAQIPTAEDPAHTRTGTETDAPGARRAQTSRPTSPKRNRRGRRPSTWPTSSAPGRTWSRRRRASSADRSAPSAAVSRCWPGRASRASLSSGSAY